ncbi:MAG: oligoendopeptidase F, partial [Eubacteriales bacterium]|nr:oligoendopeptidase F [Eubacteriales bacterium]
MNYTVKSREEIDEQYKWDLKDIFISDESWETAFNELNTVASELEGYKGRLSESSVVLAQALTIYQRASADLMELYTYAKMSKDLDNRDPV